MWCGDFSALGLAAVVGFWVVSALGAVYLVVVVLGLRVWCAAVLGYFLVLGLLGIWWFSGVLLAAFSDDFAGRGCGVLVWLFVGLVGLRCLLVCLVCWVSICCSCE